MGGNEEYNLDDYSKPPPTALMIGGFDIDYGMKSYENHRQVSSKAEYKHYGGGCSGKVTKTFKTGGFVDGRNGNQVYKKEVDYDSSFKVSDQRLGITTQYETQVKHKQTTTYANPSAKSGGGKSYGKAGYSFTKPSKSAGGVQFKNASGTSKVSGSPGVKCEIVATYTNSSGGAVKGSSSKSCSKKVHYYY